MALKITSLCIVQIDQHTVIMISINNGSLIWDLKLFMMKPGSLLFGITNCNLDEQAKEKGQ